MRRMTMKRMAVVALILAVVGLANAGLVFNVNGTLVPNEGQAIVAPGPATIILINDALQVGIYDIAWIKLHDMTLLTEADASIPANTVLTETWSIEVWGLPPAPVFWWVVNQGVQAETQPGPLFQITGNVSPLVSEQRPIVIDFLNTDADEDNPVARVTIVPEPMTMGLLGLGVLFLRKK